MSDEPERLDMFMARANAAYYATHDPFADFTTAPEITQVFGELIGAWSVVVWDAMGRPSPVRLVEAGPGRGTLMADALRTIARVAPALLASLRPHLIETSERLMAQQRARMPDAEFHARLSDVPDGPMILLANEFLDALPIRQFVRRGEQWTERFVAAGAFVEHPSEDKLGDAAEGAIVERGDAARAFTAKLATRLVRQGGAALILDYGPAERGPGDSLQALRAGAPVDPLDQPGSADLTAHVDFAGLAAVAREAGADVHGPIAQGRFLTRLGLYQRTDRLAQGKPPRTASALMESARRLAEPDRMGQLFKVMALTSAGQPTPPGFET